MRPTRAFCLWGMLLIAVGSAACQPFTTADPPSPQAATAIAGPTQAPTAAPSPTLSSFRLWAAPALPAELEARAHELREVGGRQVEWVEDPAMADVRLEPKPERPLTRWIYVAVAPFPTLADGLTSPELAGLWTEGSNLLVSDQDAAALEALFGVPAGHVVPSGFLLDAAWADRSVYAIVPFEALEPRWKVLEVDGQSPLRKDFEAEAYSLSLSFGLSGDPAAIGLIEPALAWPTSNRDPDKLTVLVMTGVTALVRGTAWRMDRYGPEYPGLQIGHWLREADIAHISHEAAFNPNCPPPDPFSPSLRFCADPDHASLFEGLGVDLIELTGNHLQDFGPDPLRFTLDLYRGFGFATFGGGVDLLSAREPALVEHNGNRLAFLGCNAAGPRGDWASERGPGALPCQDDRLMGRVSALREQGYLVVFTFQWPESISPYPLPGQVESFRRAAEAGAVIVNGSQAHRPQAMEFYSTGFIHYGLGNLFFDQMHSLALRQEFVDRHVFYQGRHISTELLTAMLEDYAQPRPMTAEERAQLLEEIFRVSGW